MFLTQINRIGKNFADEVKNFHNVDLKRFWGLGWSSVGKLEVKLLNLMLGRWLKIQN